MTREQAEQLRKLLENQTAEMTDEQILNYPDFVEKWRPNKKYEKDKRLEYNGVIYKVITTHTSQANWTPDTALLYILKYLSQTVMLFLSGNSRIQQMDIPKKTRLLIMEKHGNLK